MKQDFCNECALRWQGRRLQLPLAVSEQQMVCWLLPQHAPKCQQLVLPRKLGGCNVRGKPGVSVLRSSHREVSSCKQVQIIALEPFPYCEHLQMGLAG